MMEQDIYVAHPVIPAFFVQELAKYIPVEDPSAEDRHIWAITAFVMTGLAGALLIFTLILARRIKIAIATLKVNRRENPLIHDPTCAHG